MPGWRLEKTRAGSGERDPVFTVCLPLPLPLPSRACRARESTVSPILMYLRGRGLPVGFSPGPGPCLHLYRITRTRARAWNPVRGRHRTHCSPLRLSGRCTRAQRDGTGQE